METKWKIVIVAVVAGLLGFMLQNNGPIGQAIWPAHQGETSPEGGILAGFIAYGVLEALAFGIGVAFLVFGMPAMKRAAPNEPGLAAGAYLSVGWILVNWVPHTAMHISNDPNGWGRLLLIEYLFHVTLILAGLTLLRFFMVVQPGKPTATAPSPKGTASVLLAAPPK